MHSTQSISTTSAARDTCGYWGFDYRGTCPRVKSIEYHPDGTLKRVEFHEGRDYEMPPPEQAA